MKKIYVCDQARYVARVIIPSLFSIGICVWAVMQYFASGNLLFALLGLLSFSLPFDNIVAISHPKKVELDEEKIELYAFGRKHTYFWNGIKMINVRKTFYNKRVYLRLGKPGLIKGRYWIDGDLFQDGMELIAALGEKEAEIHPMLDKLNRRSVKKKT